MPTEHGYVVKDANGVTLANIYSRQDLHAAGWSFAPERLTADEARRIAKGIARLPEFLTQRPGFSIRGGGDHRWRRSHPYHVALEDRYVRAHWDAIDAICRLNGIPLDPTGERIDRGVAWIVYEFAVQLHAIQFWDRFDGRWLRRDGFLNPDRPLDLPKLREPPDPHRFSRRPSGR